MNQGLIMADVKEKMVNSIKFKTILVTGGAGMIGKELINELSKISFLNIKILDIKNGDNILDYQTCLNACKGIDEIYHLFGVKGNPKMTNEKPVNFMAPMLVGDTNMILAAQRSGVKRFLYTSSIAVENPESDKYPAWAKKTAETLIEAMRIQYDGTKYCIVRPANVYGRFDNFDNPNAMVVTSLIRQGLDVRDVDEDYNQIGELELDRKGAEQIRDIINAKDVARGMIKAMNEMPKDPVNLCSGKGVKIKDVAKIIAKELKIKIKYKDLNLTLGPNKKVMKRNWDNPITVSLSEGIKEVIDYVR